VPLPVTEVLLHVGIEACNRPHRFFEVRAQHANLGRSGGFVLEPDLAPHTITATPQRAKLTSILAGALGNQAKAVDADLNSHDVPLLFAVVPLDRVNLPGERVESGAVGLLYEQRQFVVGRALGNGPLDKINLLTVDLLALLRDGQCRFVHGVSS